MNAKEEERKAAKERAKSELMKHVGAGRKIGMFDLHRRVFFEDADHGTAKKTRDLVYELRQEGIAICSSRDRSGGGYWLASAGSELTDYCNAYKVEALKKLALVAKLLRMTLPALIGQIEMNLTRDNQPQTHTDPHR